MVIDFAVRVVCEVSVGARSREQPGVDAGSECFRRPIADTWKILLAIALFVGFSGQVRGEYARPLGPNVDLKANSPGKIAKKRVPVRRADRTRPKSLAKNGEGAKTTNPPVGQNRRAATTKQVVSLRRQDSNRRPAEHAIDGVAFDDCQGRLQAAMQPSKVVRLAEECEKQLSEGPLVDEVRRVAAGARAAMEIQRLAGMSSELFEDPIGDSELRGMIAKAVRGDRDAAYGVASAYRAGKPGVEPNSRRMEQWLLFSAELGHGLASWELAEHYNVNGQVSDAARFERKALDQGHRPPIRLPTRGY